MKRRFIIIMLLFAVASATAQGFDWAESFGDVYHYKYNRIKFMDTDAAGFIYIAGDCSTDAEIAGTRLLDMTPYGPYSYTICCFVAKQDPADGHVVWRKALHQNNDGSLLCNSMQLVGDSAIVLLTDDELASPFRYLYYLDTFITSSASLYPFPTYNGWRSHCLPQKWQSD